LRQSGHQKFAHDVCIRHLADIELQYHTFAFRSSR
jgi:hypothetical protein